MPPRYWMCARQFTGTFTFSGTFNSHNKPETVAITPNLVMKPRKQATQFISSLKQNFWVSKAHTFSSAFLCISKWWEQGVYKILGECGRGRDQFSQGLHWKGRTKNWSPTMIQEYSPNPKGEVSTSQPRNCPGLPSLWGQGNSSCYSVLNYFEVQAYVP